MQSLARVLSCHLPLTLAVAGLTALSVACQPVVPVDECENGLPVLGCGDHSEAGVTVTVVSSNSDQLDVPRDLAFNPDVEGELWVVNRGDDGMVIFDNVGTDAQDSEHIIDPFAEHFMEEVSAIAWGPSGRFATCHESNNTYNGATDGNDFMGPSLWSSDRRIFGQSNPEAVEGLGFDLGSHLDMLHESPFCMGIAWERDAVYWAFDGSDGSIVRYDFGQDHGVGWDDHSDGIIGRYVTGEVDRQRDVPSHMVLDHDTGLLYIADTGNSRIAVLDTNSGVRGGSLPVMEFGTEHYEVEGAELSTLIDGDDFNLDHPSGLELHNGLLYVSDNDNGNILAFNLQGEMVDFLELDVDKDALMGMAFAPNGDLYVVDSEEDELLRISPKSTD
ncbi:MAG: hypothetical protein CMP23_15565 [Rickettsiales bacterium]|nr:hypothetical protein [Rickettsiales bacterium]